MPPATPPPRPVAAAPRHAPPRQAAGDALVALVAGRRRTTGCAWERSARRHIVHHPAPPPPLAWHNLNASVAAGSTPSAAFRAILGETVEIPSSLSRDGLLTPRDEGRRFVDEKLAQYMAALFVAAVIGFALLLHACEYPAYCDDAFPYHLGRGQTHSTLAATPERLAWRNILASGGWLASVDVGPASPIHDALVWPDLTAVGTLCESDLGEWCGDVVYVRGHVWGFEGPRE